MRHPYITYKQGESLIVLVNFVLQWSLSSGDTSGSRPKCPYIAGVPSSEGQEKWQNFTQQFIGNHTYQPHLKNQNLSFMIVCSHHIFRSQQWNMIFLCKQTLYIWSYLSVSQTTHAWRLSCTWCIQTLWLVNYTQSWLRLNQISRDFP
jgi:hypothetical protein